jgi:uncharacterized membrane protein YphA (DoxX/SURF4 family)
MNMFTDTYLWIAQIAAAVIFGLAGAMKTTLSPENLVSKGMSWAGRYPAGSVKIVGWVEILGAMGLIFPQLWNIAPILTPLSALGCAIIMLLAAIDHLKSGENKNIFVNIILLALCAYITWGRLF